jgi:hypothetical protein
MRCSWQLKACMVVDTHGLCVSWDCHVCGLDAS